MIKETKNKNEYYEEGNLYVKKIKSSESRVKKDDRYVITCNIHQRGKHEYSFRKGDNWITKIYGERKLWLSDDAKTAILQAVELFDKQLNTLVCENSMEIKMEDANLSVFLSEFSDNFDCAIKYENEQTKQTVTELFPNTSLWETLHRLQFSEALRDCESKQLLQSPTKENIMKHPFILAAERSGDMKTAMRIKMFYRFADNEDCLLLAKITGKRILPALSEEYDKNYYIDADTLNNKSYALLSRSGYHIMHRPYFGMKGSTREKITLNPHTKTCVDAAKIETESISFNDFLSLFDSCDCE